MKKHLAFLILFLLAVSAVYSQPVVPDTTGKTVTFRFRPGQDLFTLRGNEIELKRLYSLVDEYRTEIISGTMPVHVNGYCASRHTEKANLRTARLRANRVKSELITRKKLKEAYFVTANHATGYNGNKDVVVVTLRVPVKTAIPEPVVEEAPVLAEPEAVVEVVPPVVEEQPAEPAPELVTEPEAILAPVRPYSFAVRTNVLYDAILLPTLGVEWRVNPDLGVKLDGSLAWWGGETGKTMKVWLLNPEVRWYLLGNKRLYAGVSGSYGKYNIYKYPLGSLLSKDTGYQGSLWGAGLTVGYQLSLSRGFSVDFNLGLGYTRFDYDSFGMDEGERVYNEREKTKNFWGPTQAGINLIWTIGCNK
ncbi:DUF3575 domain-containing protein [uncultured Sanguibacteroides sp.]|uniref:DUF3575 domain-containing protein n=1 Tax=uncultured Sanguibacteroides sp. TaxID=1635151 RepID=UPI002803B6BB|nr:DUF3575 domain-containing protein [uncultured Sanguibacteroides sp.]